jgi:capsular exopolysaccharide synthesis family protein
MNERSLIDPPSDSTGRELWTDAYLPIERPLPTAQQQPMLDVAWIRGVLFRQRWLIGGITLAAVLLGFVVTLLMTPIYQATATVRISPWGNTIVEGQEAEAPIVSASEVDNFLQTQVAVVQSRSLAEIVAADLEPGSLARLLSPDIDQSRPQGASDESWTQTKLQYAAQALQSGVTAQVPGVATIIAVSYRSDDPVLAAEIVNKYVDAFAQADVRRNLDSNAYAREYLLEQIDAVRQRLREAEQAANTYARDVGLIAPAPTTEYAEGGSTVTASNLAQINVTFADARAKRIAAEQKWQAVRDIDPLRLPEVQASGAIQTLLAEKAKLNGELSVLRQRYDDQFPVIVDIKSRIELLDGEIDRTAGDIKETLRNDFEIARRQEGALASELDNITEDALVQQNETIKYDELQREASALRLQLNSLLEQYNARTTAANVQSGTITPLDKAIVPGGPVSPNMTKNLLIAFVLGAAFAGGLALVREIFVDAFRRPEDVEDRLGLPILGVTPHVKNDELEEQGSDNFSGLMESYSSIRSALDYIVPHDGAIVQLTSSQAGEGKSTTALILAELFARLGRKTLLVDMDLRKPSLVKLLEMDKPKVGTGEVLLGRASFEEAKIEGVHAGLTILPVASTPPDPVLLLASGRLPSFLEEVRKDYSIILLDTSPVLGIADAPEISRSVDYTVFVVEANRTSFAQARTATSRLAKVGARLTGAVLTKYKPLEAGADYKYEEYYRYGQRRGSQSEAA